MTVRRIKKLLPTDNISMFCLQLAHVLKAGMTLQDGMDTLASDDDGQTESSDRSLVSVIGYLNLELRSGTNLSEAIKKSGAFPGYMSDMTQIGEKTGKLDDILLSLSDYYERVSYLNGRIRSAFFYPAILFAVMTAVIILLVGKVFPIFEDMLAQLGGTLSGGASAATSFSAGILAGRYTMIILIVIGAAAAAVFIANKTVTGKILIGKIAMIFPPTKKIIFKTAASRFSSALAVTLSSGMDLHSALEYASGLSESPLIKKKTELCLSETNSGKPLYKAMQSTGLFSSLNIKFIETGIKSGSVDEVFNKLAKQYETEADNEINRLTSLVEPVIIGILSVIIGVILISVMLPLVSIMSGL